MAAGDDHVYDEASGEWRPASELAAAAEKNAVEVRDASGSLLQDGDSVTLIKDLKVKGAGQTLKQGTVPLNQAHRQPRRDRLPPRRHQGAGAADGVRAQALSRRAA